MKVLLKSKKKNYLVTICIDNKKLLSEWRKNILPTWKIYCKKNDIGLIYFDKELVSKKNIFWKKPTWQRYLIGDKLKNMDVNNVCYMDTDILINPFSPNIFRKYNKKKILVSSNIFKLPYDLEAIQKKVVFFRKNYLNKKYPLDSAIFANLKQTYGYSNLKPQKDSLCSGVVVYNVKEHANFFKNFFYSYKKDDKSLTSGDQVFFSYYMLRYNKVELLDYKFQAYWVYEMTKHYPFLYYIKNKKIINECIESCLMNNYFLHFAGRWSDGDMWKNIFKKQINYNFYQRLEKYNNKKVFGKPIGFISDK